MTKMTWKDSENREDTENFKNLEEATQFIEEFLKHEPIILNSVKVFADDAEYTLACALV